MEGQHSTTWTTLGDSQLQKSTYTTQAALPFAASPIYIPKNGFIMVSSISH